MVTQQVVFDSNNLSQAISNRQKHKYGYLRIDNCLLSRAMVSEYYGHEIPHFKQLGLDADKKYNVLRDDFSLKESIRTFEGLPLLNQHIEISSDNIPDSIKIGSIGTNINYHNRNMIGTVMVHDKKSIDAIEHPSPYERITGLSCAYDYEPVLEHGTFDGVNYEVKMTNITGNHIALVKEPRVPQAMVADHNSIKILKEKKMDFKNLINYFKGTHMAQDADMDHGKLAKALLDIARSDASDDEKEDQIKMLLENRAKEKDDIDNTDVPGLDEEETERERKEDDRDARRDDKKEDEKQLSYFVKSTEFKNAVKDVMQDVLKELRNASERENEKESKAMDSALNLYRSMYGEPNLNSIGNKRENIYDAILRSKGIAADSKTVDEKKVMAEAIAAFSGKHITNQIASDSSVHRSQFNALKEDPVVQRFLGKK